MAAFSYFYEKVNTDETLKVLLDASHKEKSVWSRGQRAASLYLDFESACYRLIECFEEIQEENGVKDFPSISTACDMVSELGELLTFQVDHEHAKADTMLKKYTKLMKTAVPSSKKTGSTNQRGRKRFLDDDDSESQEQVTVEDEEAEAWLQEALGNNDRNVKIPRKRIPHKSQQSGATRVAELNELTKLLRKNATSNTSITILEDMPLQQPKEPTNNNGGGVNDFVFADETMGGVEMIDLFSDIPGLSQSEICDHPPMEFGRAENQQVTVENETIQQFEEAGDVSIRVDHEQPSVIHHEVTKNLDAMDVSVQLENEMQMSIDQIPENEATDGEKRQEVTTAADAATGLEIIGAPPFVTPPRNPTTASNEASPLVLGSLHVEDEPPREIRRNRTWAIIDAQTQFSKQQLQRALDNFLQSHDVIYMKHERRRNAAYRLMQCKFLQQRKRELAQLLKSLPSGRRHSPALLEVCRKTGNLRTRHQEVAAAAVPRDSQAFNHEALFDTSPDIQQPQDQERGQEEIINITEDGEKDMPQVQQPQTPTVSICGTEFAHQIPEITVAERTLDLRGDHFENVDVLQEMDIAQDSHDNGVMDFFEPASTGDCIAVIRGLSEPTYLSVLFPPTSTFKLTLVTVFEYLLELQLERKLAMEQQEHNGPVLIRPFPTTSD